MDGINADMCVSTSVSVMSRRYIYSMSWCIQQGTRLDEPPLTDLRTVREVAHVTEHTAIGHGFLRGLIGVID